jgi:FkbM family methyltransferase
MHGSLMGIGASWTGSAPPSPAPLSTAGEQQTAATGGPAVTPAKRAAKLALARRSLSGARPHSVSGARPCVPAPSSVREDERSTPATRWRSQIGQDRWVCENVFLHKRGGFFVDVGAFDGEDLSNTYVLEHHYGWRGLCVEPMAEAFAKLKHCRPGSVCVPVAAYDRDFGVLEFQSHGVLSGAVDHVEHTQGPRVHVPTMTLASLFKLHDSPRYIDFLSVDAEGSDLLVLQGIDWHARAFGAITVEHNYVEPLRSTMREFLASKGYAVATSLHWDDVFVPAGSPLALRRESPRPSPARTPTTPGASQPAADAERAPVDLRGTWPGLNLASAARPTAAQSGEAAAPASAAGPTVAPSGKEAAAPASSEAAAGGPASGPASGPFSRMGDAPEGAVNAARDVEASAPAESKAMPCDAGGVRRSAPVSALDLWVEEPIAGGLAERLLLCLIYAAAAQFASRRVQCVWDAAIDLDLVLRHVTLPARLSLWPSSDALDAACRRGGLRPGDLEALRQKRVPVESLLPGGCWWRFHAVRGASAFRADTFGDAYRIVADQLRIDHPITAGLPATFAVLHVRGRERRQDGQVGQAGGDELAASTRKVLRQWLAAGVTRWVIATDDPPLARSIADGYTLSPEPLGQQPPGASEASGAGSNQIEAELRELATMAHASLLVQHAANGWSAFSHLVSTWKGTPIINTWASEAGHLLNHLIQARIEPPGFYHSIPSSARRFFASPKETLPSVLALDWS